MAERPTIETATEPLRVEYELDLWLPPRTRYAEVIHDPRVVHFADRSWPTSAAGVDALLPYAIASSRRHGSETAVLDLGSMFGDPCYALVTAGYGTADVDIGAAELPALAEAERWLRDVLPEARASDHHVPISFWSAGTRCASRRVRRLEVPSWKTIASNYPAKVRRPLAPLMTSFRPSEGGQLLLWYGEPGTGKTYALRALAWEWREWCDLHYVTDPETLFGPRTSYLLEVLLDEDEDDDGGEDDESGRWRLLVLEDTGELLAADAKEQTGQGLSRLLNLVDGIIGQALRVLVLVTTNEPLRRLHPAVSRPGRCASKIEFVPFSGEEAERWLKRRGAAARGQRARTLAKLFAHADGDEAEPERTIGFIR